MFGVPTRLATFIAANLRKTSSVPRRDLSGPASPTEGSPPPGDDGLPLFGHALRLVRLRERPDTEPAPLLQLLADLRARHGLVFRMRLPSLGQVVYLEDPALVRTVYRSHGVTVESEFPDSVVKLFGRAVTGTAHRKMRQTFTTLVRKTLNEQDRFEAMKEMVREEMLEWCDGPRDVGSTPHNGRSYLDDKATRISLRVAVFGFLGERYAYDRALCERLMEQYAHIERGVFALVPISLPGSRMWRAGRARSAVEEILRKVLRDYAAQGISDAYIHQIHKVGVESYYSPGCGLTEEECGLRSIVGLLFASFDTTRVALMTAMAAIDAYPDIAARLREEIAGSGLADGSQPLTNKSIDELQLLDSFLWEVLRVNPVTLLNPRVVLEDFDLGPYRLKKGWHLWLPIAALCQNETIFPNPGLFDPSRFAGPARFDAPAHSDERQRREVVSWIFSSGKRACPGKPLVLAELKLMCFFLATLIDIRNRHPDAGGTLQLRSDIPFGLVRSFDPVFTRRDMAAGRSPVADEHRSRAPARQAASENATETAPSRCPIHAQGS